MKRILLTAILVLAANNAFAVGIAGTKHDLSSGNTANATYKGTSDQICKYCHVPHNAKSANILWARSGGTLPTTYYASATMNATLSAAPTASQSTLCFSCHSSSPDNANYQDFAVTIVGGANKATKTIAGTDATNGGDLTNDHPIGFVYNGALVTADGGLKPVAAAGGKDYVGATGSKLPLFGTSGSATLECASCHAVHGVGDIPMFLRTTNSGSQLCLKCHDK